MTARLTVKKNPPSLAPKMAAMSRAMDDAVPRSLREAVKLSEGMLDKTVASMVGSDMRMHNIRSRRLGARGGVRNQTKAAGQAAVGPVGPVALIDQGAPAHIIGVGKQSSAKRTFSFPGVAAGYGVRRSRDVTLGRKRKVLSWEANGTRQYRIAPLFHPGFTGKHRWVPVRDGPLARSLPKVMAFPVTRSVAAGFKVR